MFDASEPKDHVVVGACWGCMKNSNQQRQCEHYTRTHIITQQGWGPLSIALSGNVASLWSKHRTILRWPSRCMEFSDVFILRTLALDLCGFRMGCRFGEIHWNLKHYICLSHALRRARRRVGQSAILAVSSVDCQFQLKNDLGWRFYCQNLPRVFSTSSWFRATGTSLSSQMDIGLTLTALRWG